MLILYDKRVPIFYVKALLNGIPEAELLPFGGPESGDNTVYDSIICHPDIYFFQFDERTLIHAPCVPETILSVLKGHGVELIKGERDPYGVYPHTARYNGCMAGGRFFHNKTCTDHVILEYVQGNGIEVVDVSQGYTRCSVAAIGENRILTSDRGICRKAEGKGIVAQYVTPEKIHLPGERYGFLGGTCGTYGNKIFFLGDIDELPGPERVRELIASSGFDLFEISGKALFDAGGLFIL